MIRVAFKKLRGIALPEERQGMIRFTCLTYADQPKHIQEKIRLLCQEAGGPYGAAVWEVMCTQESIISIAMRHHVSESTLYRARKDFYENWFRKKKGRKPCKCWKE